MSNELKPYTVQETEATPNGLDFLVLKPNGEWFSWAYSLKDAHRIADAMNNRSEDKSK